MAKSIKCKKCGGNDLTVKYQAEKKQDVDVTANKGKECLQRKCKICGYAWEEPCEDAI